MGTDPDPDPLIRILLFSSVADKMPTKNKFVFKSFLLLLKVYLYQSLKIKSQKEVKIELAIKVYPTI